MKIHAIIAAIIISGTGSTALAKEIYVFDQAGSTIGFAVRQFLGTTNGKFAKFEGKIDLDRPHPENSSVTVKIDVRSITTGIQKRDDHLRSPEFFNAETFPEIAFKSRSAKQTGPQSGDIVGDLTMHSVTRPITLNVKLATPLNETQHMRWTVTTEPIKRRDFGLLFPSGLEAVSGISQTVAIHIEIEARRMQ